MWKQFSVDDGGTLRLRWFRGPSILFIVVAIGWTVFGYLSVSPFVIGMSVLAGLYALRSIVNTTAIAVHDRLVVVTHGPLPAWRNRKISIDAITQIWMRDGSSTARRDIWDQYDVIATLKDGRYVRLAFHTTREDARDITIELQRRLGLRHGEVPSASASSRSI